VGLEVEVGASKCNSILNFVLMCSLLFSVYEFFTLSPCWLIVGSQLLHLLEFSF
jgi:hypothetical protein